MTRLDTRRWKFSLPLHFAIFNKMTSEVRYLVESGADVDAQDENGRTPLMMCCFENDEDWSIATATMILQTGANAACIDLNKRDALMYALIFGRKRLSKLLLRSRDCDLNQRDACGRTAMDYAALIGDHNLINALIQQCRPNTTKSLENSPSKHIENLFVQPRNGSASLLRRPKSSPACQVIIRDTLDSAREFKSNSNMNTHQFRRLVMKGLNQNTKPSYSRPVNQNTARAKSAIIHNSTAVTTRGDDTVRLLKRRTRQRAAPESWKAAVPILWSKLTVQHCPSYRPSAKRTLQTFEEALGIPPVDDGSEDATVTGDDKSFLDDIEQSNLLRRSSLPASSQSSHSSLKSRRRSEAVGLSSSSITKFFFSEKKVNELSIGSANDEKITKDMINDDGKQAVNEVGEEPVSPNAKHLTSLTSPNVGTRSNSLPSKDRVEHSVAIRKAAAAFRRGSFPRARNQEISNDSKLDVNSPESNNASPLTSRDFQSLRRRRRESTLRETSMLSDITEEQESTSLTRRPKTGSRRA